MGARVYIFEAWHELRAGLRSSLVPIMFLGLVGYVFMMLTNAEYLRDMGAADVPRNSAHVIFQMTSGQSFWLVFAWAWVFSQTIARDRAASLHEVVFAAPVSLPGLIMARYAGALVLGCVLGSSSSVAFLLVPALAALGVLPADAVGPTPYGPIAWAWLLFVLPSAIGLGALYLVVALRTRNMAGPFAAASLVILVWMVAMVVLRRGDAGTELATLIDASGFGEAELQTKRWTPAEKAHSLLALTPALMANRLLWMLLPLALLVVVVRSQQREGLVLERSARRRPRASTHRRGAVDVAPLPPVTSPSWLRATLLEAAWHLRQSLQGPAFYITGALWAVINIAAPFAHMTVHAEGPLLPRPELLVPFLIDFGYVFSVFVVAGFVGLLARRDQRPGFDQIIDALPAPLGTRVVARALAASALTVVLALTPSLSAWIVTALTVPESFAFWTPLELNALVAAPALLEICGLTFCIHALLRSAGTAHALSMLVAFIVLINHEVGLVSYPPAQIGVPVHIALSELTGWAPWLAPVLALDAFKLGVFGASVALAWAVYPRGAALRPSGFLRQLRRRLAGGAGVLALASVAVLVLVARVLDERLVVLGGFSTPATQRAEDAAWEKEFWNGASTFSVEGGEVRARIDVEGRRAEVDWRLVGVRAAPAMLHGRLRHGMVVKAATSNGVPRDVQMAHEHFAVSLGECASAGCEVELNIEVSAQGWPAGAEPGWSDGVSVWARATDLLPRLGLDAERALRAPRLRREQGLAARLELPAPAALPAAAGVAPAAKWAWSVEVDRNAVLATSRGSTTSMLDFAVSSSSGAATLSTRVGDVTVLHGPTHQQVAREIAEDVLAMQRCVEREIGMPERRHRVVQVPRGLGEAAVHGDMLWLPEHDGWDVGSVGPGRVLRRAKLATVIVRNWLVEASALRASPGARWLTEGVAGWVGLECIRLLDGSDAWLRALGRQSDGVIEALGALDAPVMSLADDAGAAWVSAYGPLSVMGWAQQAGHDDAVRAIDGVVAWVRSGMAVPEALERVLGADTARRLLGPPFSSEVTVAALNAEQLSIRGERFSWQAGGWQQVASGDVLQRFDDNSIPASVTRVPATVLGSEPFAAFDVWPSFERSPLDNTWRGRGQ
jgi:hypothetical protein